MSDDKDKSKEGKVIPLIVPINTGQPKESKETGSESRGIYTDDQMDEMYPPFQVIYEKGFTQSFTHSKFTLRENGVLLIHRIPNESWLPSQLVQVIKTWILIEYYDRGDNPF